ncbi:MAG: hypothetical protein DRR16_07425 [Candidatus Parabeggiatoa sp. nov. 3]|nr:MAG: hypothetical protein DRR00_13115 [Gammaproteobacteria bacterium]RKZ65559.1 MAG: hypothetical protein DRQ99_12320 [Gammaproteobacteria bacterium]RKZ87374.1 MAG: hypothetical protein DRR16_07425 [Gammaproteobacteria bacterium]
MMMLSIPYDNAKYINSTQKFFKVDKLITDFHAKVLRAKLYFTQMFREAKLLREPSVREAKCETDN